MTFPLYLLHLFGKLFGMVLAPGHPEGDDKGLDDTRNGAGKERTWKTEEPAACKHDNPFLAQAI